MSTIGDNIRKARLEKGLTQKQLGDLCGMADSAIRRYETGKGNPKRETLQRIANALEISSEYLLGGEPNPGAFFSDFSKYARSVGRKIFNTRLALSISEDEFAEKIGVHVRRIQSIEFGLDLPNDNEINKICEILNVSAEYLGLTEQHALFSDNNETELYDDAYKSLVTAFNQLNEEGQQVAVERVEELTEIPKYQK